MIDQKQAKKEFRNDILLMLVTILWPAVGITASVGAAITGFKYTAPIFLLSFAVGIALWVWFFVRLWRLGKHVGMTPWAALWLLLPFFGIFIVSMLFLEPLKHLADAKPQGEALPLTWDIIKETWRSYSETFNKTYRTSVYFILVSIIYGAILAPAYYYGTKTYLITTLVLVLPLMVANIWISIMVFMHVRSLDEGTAYSPLPPKEGLISALLFLLTALLMALLSAGPFIVSLLLVGAGGAMQTAKFSGYSSMALIGLGVIAAIPSFIWLIYKSMVWNSFSLPVFLIQGKKNMENLRVADAMGKKRWWGLFWKNQMAGMTFGAYGTLISLALSILVLILSFVFKALNLGQTLNIFLSASLNGAAQVFLSPLLMAFSLKLYRAFEKHS